MKANRHSEALSVVIPTYNGARFLRDAVESVFSQTRLPDELIVVDDCSTDDTVTLAESMGARAPLPMRVIRLERNSGGPARPINVGVAATHSELIGVLDQDDRYTPSAMASAVAALTSAPECTVACHWAADFDKPEKGPKQTEEFRRALCAEGTWRGGFYEIPGPIMLARFFSHYMFLYGFPGFVFRRACWEQMGRVDEKLGIASDVKTLGWLFQHGAAAVTPEVGYLRRLHDNNITTDVPRTCYEFSLLLIDFLRTAECLQGKTAPHSQAKNVVRGAAHLLRHNQHYPEAVRLYRSLRLLGDSRGMVLSAIAKVYAHRVISAVRRKWPKRNRFAPSNASVHRRTTWDHE